MLKPQIRGAGTSYRFISFHHSSLGRQQVCITQMPHGLNTSFNMSTTLEKKSCNEAFSKESIPGMMSQTRPHQPIGLTWNREMNRSVRCVLFMILIRS